MTRPRRLPKPPRRLANEFRVDLIGKLVDRFLAWPLPDSVCSDLCVTKQGGRHRTGTNLLTADEARQMFDHLFAKPLLD